MKILVLSQHWAPESGVPQRRWAWLSSLLADQGHRVFVIAPSTKDLKEQRIRSWIRLFGTLLKRDLEEVGTSGERIHWAASISFGNSLTGKALSQAMSAISMLVIPLTHPRYFLDEKPDVIIGTVPALPTAFVTFLVSRWLRVPYIIDLRDAWPDLLRYGRHWNSGVGEKSWREKILTRGPLQMLVHATEWALNKALNEAAGILTTSELLQEHLERSLASARGGGRKLFATIRNVFPSRGVPKVVLHRNLENGLNVLYAGTVGRAQRIDNAVQAARIAKDKGFKVNLKIVGEGASWQTVRQKAIDSGSNVEVLHSVGELELKELYEWADTALVHLANWEPLERTVPSKTYELFSNMIHVSAVASGETAMLVRSLGAGSVVDPGSPSDLAKLWISLIEQPSLLEIGESGRAWVNHERELVAPSRLEAMLEAVASKRQSKIDGENSSEDK